MGIIKVDLNGKWQMNISGDDKWYAATVPGCNYLDLMDNGVIADPFYGTNEKELYWVSERDCQYQREFLIDELMLKHDKILLVCKTLDTLAEITINNEKVANANNCHMEYKFDIKRFVKIGVNNISILFKSPVNYVNNMQKIESCPNNCNGLTGIPHIRKPQCHFGWDWGPVLTPSGISGDIYIEGESDAALGEVKILQKHENEVVTLNIEGEIDNYSNASLSVKIEIYEPNGKIIARRHDNLQSFYDDTVVIEKPQLWWTKELSDTEKQPLYTVKITLIKDDQEIGSLDRKIGLRTINLNREVDKFGQNFQFILNGIPIFAKGANWIPPDSFRTRATKEVLEFYIKTAINSNFNMLRVWGGGYYESDTFYDLCDEYGLLVWQDFPFACQPYPFFMDEYRMQVLAEIEQNIKRLRHRASLCLWCGNNEIEAMALGWAARRNYVKWTEKFFWEILPDFVRKHDVVTSFIPGSPVGVAHGKGHSNDNVGDTHLWAVWHGLQPMTYYRRRMTRFCSEFGFESLPDLKTILTFAQEKDYSLTSSVFSSHQKCASGNAKMAYYIASRFRLPKNFTDYVYLSQVCQQECIMDATEHWRRNKGQCNGSLFWQFNDCWPVCSWSSVDYNRCYKALQYTSKHFFAPTMISIENTKNEVNIYAINDRITLQSCTGECKLIDFDGKTHWSETIPANMNANSVSKILSVKNSELASKKLLKKCVLVVNLYNGKNLINTKTLLFEAEKHIKLPKAKINMKCEIDGDMAVYTLQTDKFARIAALHSADNCNPFSDNYFDLIPGETKVITQKLSADQINASMTAAQLSDQVSVKSVCDIVAKGIGFMDALYRIKVFLTPVNFFSWIYNNSIPAKITPSDEDKTY